MKASNSNKDPIHLASKKEEFENSHHTYHKNDKLKLHSISDHTHKVLEYPSKTKQGVKKLQSLKKKSKSYLRQHNFFKFIIISLIVISILFIIDKLFYNNGTLSYGYQKIYLSENTDIVALKNLTIPI